MRLRLRKPAAIVAVMIPAVVAAATTMLALVPAGAQAHRHPSPGGACNIRLNVSPARTVAGDQVVAYGRLTCRSQSVAGQSVQLYEHTFGASGYTLAQTVTTDPHGYYQSSPITEQTNSVFYASSQGAQSARRRVRVEAQVTLAGPPAGTQLMTGAANSVQFTGTVTPADEGARVVLQRQNALTGNLWRGIATGIVGSGGAYTITHTFVVPGDANLRVLVRSQGRNAPSVSNELTYEISQAQNPQLTINASADPITYGQSVTISGTAAGAASQPVTLYARIVHQHGFTAVAETTTNASGEYTFAAQSPTNSTFYEVRTGTGHSSGSGNARSGDIAGGGGNTAGGGGNTAGSGANTPGGRNVTGGGGRNNAGADHNNAAGGQSVTGLRNNNNSSSSSNNNNNNASDNNVVAEDQGAAGRTTQKKSESAVLFEGVQDVLTASVSQTTVQAGQPLTFSGTVMPAPAQTHIVYLERQDASNTGFHVVAVGAIDAGTTSYSLTYTSYVPGTRVYRVRVPGGPANEGAVSQPFTITITPAPAAALRPEAPGNFPLITEGSERGGEERESGAEGEGSASGGGGAGRGGSNGHHRRGDSNGRSVVTPTSGPGDSHGRRGVQDGRHGRGPAGKRRHQVR